VTIIMCALALLPLVLAEEYYNRGCIDGKKRDYDNALSGSDLPAFLTVCDLHGRPPLKSGGPLAQPTWVAPTYEGNAICKPRRNLCPRGRLSPRSRLANRVREHRHSVGSPPYPRLGRRN
jgi:hypothetical protein